MSCVFCWLFYFRIRDLQSLPSLIKATGDEIGGGSLIVRSAVAALATMTTRCLHGIGAAFDDGASGGGQRLSALLHGLRPYLEIVG